MLVVVRNIQIGHTLYILVLILVTEHVCGKMILRHHISQTGEDNNVRSNFSLQGLLNVV